MVHESGYYPGNCILINSGLTSHGDGLNRGLSKGLSMAFVLLVCPYQYVMNMDWSYAWIPINMQNPDEKFRPIIMALAHACHEHFWVC